MSMTTAPGGRVIRLAVAAGAEGGVIGGNLRFWTYDFGWKTAWARGRTPANQKSLIVLRKSGLLLLLVPGLLDRDLHVVLQLAADGGVVAGHDLVALLDAG